MTPMAVRTRKSPELITSARVPRSLDADQRNKRYLITMAIRTVCFLAGALAPSPWNWMLFISAALLPGAAVLLANSIDRRGETFAESEEPTTFPALTTGHIVPGEVEDPTA